MAEVRLIRVDQKDAETGYLELTPVVAELVKVVSNQASQGYGLYNIRDFTGQEICVLLRGRNRPTQNDVGKIAVFAISGQTDGNKVKYSGFYNAKDEIPPQYQGKRPPQPAGETTGGGSAGSAGSRGGGKSGGNRSFALSYAKDLACAGAIKITELPGTAVKFNTYLDTGIWSKVEQPKQTTWAPVERPVEEDVVPEMGSSCQPPQETETGGAGGFDAQYPTEKGIGGSGGGGATFTGEGGLGGDDVPF